MLLFMTPWSNHTWVRSFYRLYTHEYFNVRPFLLGMSIASLCNPLASNPARQRSLNYFRFFFESTPSYWTYFRLKTATPEVLINEKFPPEQAILASQNETRLVRSEMWICQCLIRVYKLNAYSLNGCSYYNVKFLSEIFNMIFIAIEWLYRNGD